MLETAKREIGFTLIELLVVVAIIGLLASIVISNLTTARTKSRDARRIVDMEQIYNAVEMYNDQYGCLPSTSGTSCPGAGGYSGSDAGGWDYSSQGSGFMTFLQSAGFMGKVPFDPINNMMGDSNPGMYAYKYYCYAPTDSNPGLRLGYFTEIGGWSEKIKNVQNNAGGHDSGFPCK
jgi:prepilin-type N-terminal cleavage/methylation domain-containing protein